MKRKGRNTAAQIAVTPCEMRASGNIGKCVENCYEQSECENRKHSHSNHVDSVTKIIAQIDPSP